MLKYLLFPTRTLSMASVGVGVVSTLAFKKYGRPLAVEVLKVGYEVKDSAESLMADAHDMASEARAEAKSKSKSASKS